MKPTRPYLPTYGRLGEVACVGYQYDVYGIIARWKQTIERRGDGRVAQNIRQRIQGKVQDGYEVDDTETPFRVTTGPAATFFAFTSNVDAHFYDSFLAHEIQ